MTSLVMGLPLDLEFRTKGQLATDICADCYVDGLAFDFICGDEVYGSCTRCGSSSRPRARPMCCASPPASSSRSLRTKLTCAEAAKRLVKDKRRWEVRSAARLQGRTLYAWACIGTATRGTTCWSAAT